jgi:hypothetical protein
MARFEGSRRFELVATPSSEEQVQRLLGVTVVGLSAARFRKRLD